MGDFLMEHVFFTSIITGEFSEYSLWLFVIYGE